jgi:protocatechuate 3,4-dioxygenase beta subunit
MLPSFLLAIALQAGPPPLKATVRGKVTADETGKPLKRAQIVFRKMPQGVDLFQATTDATGHFEIKLDPGRYRAVASRTGFVSRGYKAKLTSQVPIALALTAGGTVEDVDFSLAAGGVLTGRISDEDGSVLPGVNVRAMRKTYDLQGKSHLQLVSSGSTDDHGEYRIYDLAPGRYYLKAESEAGKIPFGSIIYPNAKNMIEARTVALALGGEVKDINMTLPDTEVYTITGKVADSHDAPIKEAFLGVWPLDWTSSSVAFARGRPDGTFRLANVPAGRYRVHVSAGDGRLNLDKMVDVSSSDINVPLTLGQGATVKGIVTAEGGKLPASVRLQLVVAGNDTPDNSSYRGSTQSTADGSFDFQGVQPCTCVVMASQAVQSAAMFLSSVKIGPKESEKDVTESGFAVPESGEVEISVVVDFAGGRISGKATDADGKPLERVPVAVFSADPKKRANPRYTESEFTDAEGAFRLVGIVPGDYLMLVFPDEDPGPIFDPEVFAKFEKLMLPVTVERSGVITKDIQLTKELAALFKSLQ